MIDGTGAAARTADVAVSDGVVTEVSDNGRITETAERVLDRSIQIHGGMGLAKELPLERWYREMRTRRIGEGPSEVHRMVVARDLLGAQR